MQRIKHFLRWFWYDNLIDLSKVDSRCTSKVHIRIYNDNDYTKCTEIYKKNMPKHFPENYLETYEEYLKKKEKLILVVEKESKVIGNGGIYIAKAKNMECAELCYGMIAPEFHRQGFGTALVLARIALLPDYKDRWFIFLSTIGGSETFYKQYGFGRFELGNPELYYAIAPKKHIHCCRVFLETHGVHIPENINIPKKTV